MAGKQQNLKQALKKKKARIWHYDVATEDSEVVDKLKAAVNKAEQRVGYAFLADDDARRLAEEDLASAKDALAQCFIRLSFKGLSEPAFDKLVAEYPPTEEQRKDGHLWDPEVFPYALLVACNTDPKANMTVDDWVEMLNSDDWPRPDKDGVLNTVLMANQRDANWDIPKD